MARLFDDGSSEYLKNSTPVVTPYPITMAAWARPDDVTIDQAIFGISDEAEGSFAGLWMVIKGADAGDYVQARGYLAGLLTPAITTVGVSVNTWHHCAIVCTSSSLWAAFLDGGGKGTSNPSGTPGSLDNTTIGTIFYNAGVADWPFSGRIADAAIWNVALRDAEVAILAKGYSPLFVRPQSLVAYWPLIRTDNDRVGGYHMTPYNTPTFVAHPGKLIYPAAVITTTPTSGIAETTYAFAAAIQAILKEAYSKTAAMAAVLKESVAGTAAMQAWLQARTTVTAPMQAKLKEAYSKTAPMAAKLKEAYSKTAAMAATLKESVASTAAMQAVLKEAYSVTAAMRGVLKETYTKTAAMQAYLQDVGAVTRAVAMLAVLKEAVSNSAAIQSVFKEVYSATAAMQAWLQDRTSTSAAMRAVLRMKTSTTAAMQAYLAGGVAVTADMIAPPRGFTMVAPERQFTMEAPPRGFTMIAEKRNG